MDFMIWAVAIALFGYLVYAMLTSPPSSGCLSADLARARDEQKKAEAVRREAHAPEAVAPVGSPTEALATPLSPAEPPMVAAASSGESPIDLLRNPSTGEAAAIPTNYRFAKRWIKEAMVAEGLLEKVYTNAELDAVTADKVRSALAEFKKLTKYRA